MKKKTPPPSPEINVEQQKAVPSYTNEGVRILMAELAAAMFARVVRNMVLSGKVDGQVLNVLLPDADAPRRFCNIGLC